MYYKLLLLLNVKPHESKLVRKLFTIQFFLGVATAFLFTSSLTMFLSSYEIKTLPVSFILSACLLIVFNRIYSYLDEHMTSPRLLKVVIFFSAASILIFWLLLNFLPFKQLPLLISGFYMLIYMIVGYAFWGMASIIFNVRESRRLFSIVGAGDIPAKMLGYFSVTALVPYIGVNNLLLISIVSFCIAFFLLNRFQSQGFLVEDDPNAVSHSTDKNHASAIHFRQLVTKFFTNRLVLFIALLSLISYIVFALIDFTFLSDIKIKYKNESQLAAFIAIFFASGRLVAIGLKLLFSSRMISKMGLSNSLLLTPILLLAISIFIIAYTGKLISHMYIFGVMVLLTEILRSTVQEPVFFILFQPLKPHDRLRGHLIAKGHTLPFALLPVGIFLVLYFNRNNELAIKDLAAFLIVLLVAWIATIFFIKREYLKTLITSLKKGYFTGAELFLNDNAVINLLLKKAESKKPLEVIHSLNLLERSGYPDFYKLLISKLSSPVSAIKDYVLLRVIANNMTSSLPVIKQQLNNISDDNVKPKLIKAYYFLNKELNGENLLKSLHHQDKRAAMEGLLLRKEAESEQVVIDNLTIMASGNLQDKLLVLDVLLGTPSENYTKVLSTLLRDDNPEVYKKAMEGAGKAKDLKLFQLVTEVAIFKHAYSAFIQSLKYYGDEVFSIETWPVFNIPEDLLYTIIKTTGNIKGENSTNFLIQLLKNKSRYGNEVIEALWLKKSQVSEDVAELLEQWINKKAEQSKHKVERYYEVYSNKDLKLLQHAIFMDIRKDLQVLLKVCSLLFDREKVDRVIELLSGGNISKISNAIEILELTIPKKYFYQVNILVELVDEINQGKTLISRPHTVSTVGMIEKVIKDTTANFSEWTKSIACYTLPKLQNNERSLHILEIKVAKDEHLFNETRDYVLSMLK